MSATKSSKQPEELLPLSPAVYHILLALADGKEKHGYSIMQEIGQQTEKKLKVGPTTLYRSIKHMLEAGMITEVGERPDAALDDERRRYYRLTSFGQEVALAETQRLAQALAVAQSKPLLHR